LSVVRVVVVVPAVVVALGATTTVVVVRGSELVPGAVVGRVVVGLSGLTGAGEAPTAASAPGIELELGVASPASLASLARRFSR